MFTYRCLQCGKQHSSPDAFAEGYRAKCLRCSHAFEVNREMARAADGESAAGRPEAITAPAPGGTIPSAGTPDRIARAAKRKPAPPPEPAGGDVEGLDAIDALDATPEELESLERSALASEPEGNPSTKKKAKDATPAAGKKRRLILTAAAGAIVLICAAGGYLAFGGSAKPKPPVAKSAPPKAKPRPTPAPPPKVVKKADPPAPAVAGPPVIAFTMSAPRLAAEIAARPAGADLEYKDAWMEVSGLFDKVDTIKPAKGTPVTRALFRTQPGPVVCDLSSALPAELAAWRALKPGKPFNVQGVYGGAGVLSKCVLTPTRARADTTFGGRPVELRGLVDAVRLPGPGVEFPTVELEAGTNSIVSLRCLFRKEDAPKLKLLEEGAAVIIKGDCAGRRDEGDRSFVRLDNCEFVATTGPAPSVPRMAPIDLAREFDEDLRPYYLPPPAPRDPAAPALSVTQLGKEWKADKKGLEKYRNRILTVTGRPSEKTPGRLILEGGETDQALTVACRFGRALRGRLADLPEYRVYGVCGGMEGERTLRLDDCGADASQLRPDGPSLTPEYLPHRPGARLVYDFVGHPIAEKKPAKINRQVWLQREGGVTETVITHAARFSGPSLFAPGHKDSWVEGPKVAKARIPGPVYVQKNSPLLIDLGQRIPRAEGGPKVETKLALKVGVKAGEKWEWAGEDGKHSYTLVRFDRWRGRRTAVVRESITRPVIRGQESEVEHVFARDVGEVERREWLRITSDERKLIWESKMIVAEPALGGQPPSAESTLMGGRRPIGGGGK